MMKVSNTKVKKALEIYDEIVTLSEISAVLGWDTNVNLPEKASASRATQSSYLTKLIAQKWHDKTLRESIESVDMAKLSTLEKQIVRNLLWEGKYFWEVPEKVVVEFSEVTSQAFMAWQKARQENKFKAFEPHLKKIVALNQKIAKHLGYADNPYDALLDRYEPGLTTHKMQEIFDLLIPFLSTLVKDIKKSKAGKSKPISGKFAQKDQEALTLLVLKKMGYDLKAGRQDVSAHPFTESLGEGDVRITNRYTSKNPLEPLMVAMHEGGHALYEQGLPAKYVRSPLGHSVSLGIHESQSRFWENQIGRSEAFAHYIVPHITKQFGKKTLSARQIFTHLNTVTPGFIRVEADEVTYNLHIALRFEIEEGLIGGRLKVSDLPEIWNQKMKHYLGITPKTDAEGVLQDVHWSYGAFGYFPTYTLGNLYAAQFNQTMDLDLARLTKKGDFAPVLSWLRKNIHERGSTLMPEELCEKVTGKRLDPSYFMDYITTKYASLYGLAPKLNGSD